MVAPFSALESSAALREGPLPDLMNHAPEKIDFAMLDQRERGSAIKSGIRFLKPLSESRIVSGQFLKCLDEPHRFHDGPGEFYRQPGAGFVARQRALGTIRDLGEERSRDSVPLTPRFQGGAARDHQSLPGGTSGCSLFRGLLLGLGSAHCLMKR